MGVFSPEELQEGSKALQDVLEHDLPKMLREKPKTVSHITPSTCDRCGRDLYGASWICLNYYSSLLCIPDLIMYGTQDPCLSSINNKMLILSIFLPLSNTKVHSSQNDRTENHFVSQECFFVTPCTETFNRSYILIFLVNFITCFFGLQFLDIEQFGLFFANPSSQMGTQVAWLII